MCCVAIVCPLNLSQFSLQLVIVFLKKLPVLCINETRMQNSEEPDGHTESNPSSLTSSALLSSFIEKTVAYISGFVVHKLRLSIHCEICLNALTAPCSSDNPIYNLIKQKNRGSLIPPSKDVLDICLLREKLFRSLVTVNGKSLTTVQSHQISNAVLKNFLHKDCFSSLAQHV